MVALAHLHPSVSSPLNSGGARAATRHPRKADPACTARRSAVPSSLCDPVVSQENWGMSQKSWGKTQNAKRDFVAEASDAIKTFAGRPTIGDKTKRQIERAARATGLGYWQAFDLWYGKASAKAAELFIHRLSNNAARAADALAHKREQENTDARIELATLKARIAELEARIAGVGQATPA